MLRSTPEQRRSDTRFVVVGEKEQEADLVSVRSRFAGDEGQKNLETFIADIQKEIADRVKREVVKEDEK